MDIRLYDWTYHSLICICGLVSLWLAIKVNRRFWYLAIMFVGTLALEISAVTIMTRQQMNLGYHCFVLFEYTLYILYYEKEVYNRIIKKGMMISIPLFLIWSIALSAKHHFTGMPAANINSSGLILIVVAVYRIFHLNVLQKRSPFSQTDFWIGIAIMIFFGGTFFANFMYQMLHDRNLAERIFDAINEPVNLLYYFIILIGLLCSIPRKSISRP